jgi:hypothetical protein
LHESDEVFFTHAGNLIKHWIGVIVASLNTLQV